MSARAKLDVYLLERDLLLSVPNEEQAIATLISRLAAIASSDRHRSHRPPRACVRHGSRCQRTSRRRRLTAEGASLRRRCRPARQDRRDRCPPHRPVRRYSQTRCPSHRRRQPQIIKDLVVRRRQLTSLRTMEKNRRQIMPESLKPSIDRIIETLDRELESLEQLIQNAVEQHAAWRHKRDLLTSMPGIGRSVASTLIGDLPSSARSSPTDRRSHRRRSFQPR